MRAPLRTPLTSRLLPYVRPLTLSGNEITDALRSAALSGDGLLRDGSLGAWQAATNVANGAIYASATGGGTIDLVNTEQLKFGPTSIKMVTAGTTANEGVRTDSFAVIANTNYMLSYWFFGVTAGESWTIVFDGRSAADGFLESLGSVTFVATGGWQLVKSVLGTTGALSVKTRLRCTHNSQSIQTFYLSGVMFETGKVVTPFAPVSRAAARIQVPTAGLFTPINGWIALRIRWGMPTGNPLAVNSRAMVWGGGGGHVIHLVYVASSDLWQLRRNGGASVSLNTTVTNTHAIGNVQTVVAYWTPSGLFIMDTSVQTAFDTAADAQIPALVSPLDLMGDGTTLLMDSDLIWWAAGMGVPSPADALALKNLPNIPRASNFPRSLQLKGLLRDGVFRSVA